jgi:hypothetical protein
VDDGNSPPAGGLSPRLIKDKLIAWATEIFWRLPIDMTADDYDHSDPGLCSVLGVSARRMVEGRSYNV